MTRSSSSPLFEKDSEIERTIRKLRRTAQTKEQNTPEQEQEEESESSS